MKNYNYKETDCGAMGKTFERNLKACFNHKEIVSRQGKIDFRRDHKCYEIKTGAGELDSLLKGKIKYVCYVPVVNMNLDIEQQEGFILEREIFLNLLKTCGLIRNKTATNGSRKVTIQTFWNNSKNAPHSKKKYELLLSELYDNCIMTLEEYFECEGKF